MQVLRVKAEVAAFTQASHVYWGVWALLQARYSSIDFDYFAYSDLRFARFQECAASVEAHVSAEFEDSADANGAISVPGCQPTA